MCSDQKSHGYAQDNSPSSVYSEDFVPPQALAENPNGVQSFSPGLAAAAYPGYAGTNDSTLKELNHRTHLTVASNPGRSRLLGIKHTVSHDRMTLSFEPCATLCKPTQTCATPLPPRLFFASRRHKRRNWFRNGGHPRGLAVTQSPPLSCQPFLTYVTHF